MKNKILSTFIIIFICANANALKVLVWNTKKSQNDDWAQYTKKIAKDADFVLLQEAIQTETFYNPLEELFKRTRFYLSWKNEKFQTGLLTASHYWPYYTRKHVSPIVEPILSTPKLISEEKYLYQGRNLLILNIHAINFRLFEDYKKYLLQVKNVLSRHRGPIIFAGDFNTWSQARKNFVDQYLEQFGLKEVSIKRYENTFIVLDHIYTRGFEKTEAYQLEDSSTSDHYPIILNVE